MNKKIILNNKTVSCGSPAYIIAEIGLNHNNDIELAKKMISSAKESGADAVKFQYYITENLMVADSPAFGIFKELEISPDFMKDVKDFYENKHVNSDLMAVNFTDMTEKDFYEALCEANHRLLNSYYDAAKKNALDIEYDLYMNQNASFRGFRQT